MRPEIPKTYDPTIAEDDLYRLWENSGFFKPENLPGDRAEIFSLAMPPPNVTGVLHLGHALENALMDTMIRYQRMRGKRTLLIPGTDHAAVATQARVEKNLIESGEYTHPREQLGREKLLEIIRQYAEESKTTILSQIKKMGTSCDWSRLAYTFDEQRSQAVNELFVRMYKDGLIYRGYRVINWSVKGQSTCSDDELVYKERSAKLYTFRYAKDFPIPISSTRPETKLGDTAVAVHPHDARYKTFIGKTFTVDVGAAHPLQIKIIADPSVDPAFGTGALGVTPAHSAVDYEMYEKRKGSADEIDLIPVIGADGLMTPRAGAHYEGLTAEAAREKFVAWLRSEELLEHEEDIQQNVGTSDRFGDVVEALPMEQWFIAVNKKIPDRGLTLKDLLRTSITTGHRNNPGNKIRITPDRFEKIYLIWIDNLRDWCISRQIWWGHRIPVWYKRENQNSIFQIQNSKNNMYVGVEPPEEYGWEQDPDTLDTWFSSGAWTFSTLGWPEKTNDLTTFHPTTWMQMGHEILFFWMARMILMSTYALDEIPFKDVYIHGILRDQEGKKFSKSLGNGIDPLDMIAKYGTDALRLALMIGITPGNDSRFYEEKVEHYRNFINKLWNISRFILTSAQPQELTQPPQPSTLADRWIISRLNTLTLDVENHFEQYRFAQAAEQLYSFTWHEFADWYLEIAKTQLRDERNLPATSATLGYTLNTILTLWHPFIPFVTEYIHSHMKSTWSLPDELLMVHSWPSAHGHPDDSSIEAFTRVQNIVTTIRNFRSERRIDPKYDLSLSITAHASSLDQEEIQIISTLARVRIANNPLHTTTQLHVAGYDIFIDIPQDPERTVAEDKEKADLTRYIESLERQLSDSEFTTKAPPAVLEKTKQKLSDAKARLAAYTV